jgi:hypothetical protein
MLGGASTSQTRWKTEPLVFREGFCDLLQSPLSLFSLPVPDPLMHHVRPLFDIFHLRTVTQSKLISYIRHQLFVALVKINNEAIILYRRY